MRRFKVVLYEDMHPAGQECLRQAGCEVVLAPAQDEGTICRLAADADGIIIRAVGRVSRRVMVSAPCLKVIGRHGTGVDNIDLVAAAERGITVVNTPLAAVRSVAEHAVSLMIAAARKLVLADRAARTGNWNLRYDVRLADLHGRVLGIVGLGRIGTAVARICRTGFEMIVTYYDIRRNAEAEIELDARWLPIEGLLRTADFISLHIPYSPATHHLISRERLDLVKPTAILVNTSRGAVVDEAALVAALAEGRLLGAGLDVFEQEPIGAASPLAALPNVVLTPHIAAHSEESLKAMSLVAEDVVRVLEGKPPRFPVSLPDEPADSE